jgi:hypothetical protein
VVPSTAPVRPCTALASRGQPEEQRDEVRDVPDEQDPVPGQVADPVCDLMATALAAAGRHRLAGRRQRGQPGGTRRGTTAPPAAAFAPNIACCTAMSGNSTATDFPAWIEFDAAAQVAQLGRTVTKKGKKTVFTG